MPRLARTVFAGVPHHVTQRGNRREDVFFNDDHRVQYLEWLEEYCQRYYVDVLAYCLMTNHVHLVLVPRTETGLQQVLKPLHMRYAQRLNRERGWKGHVWQGRYFSSPLDERYTWAAIRYAERNPVRAEMVKKAETYPWSSAAAHCGLRTDSVLTTDVSWQKQFHSIENWSSWLAEGEKMEERINLRRNVEKGLPCGAEAFIHKLEQRAGRTLAFRPQGRPRNEKG